MQKREARSAVVWFSGASLLLFPWLIIRLLHLDVGVVAAVVLSGVSIVGAGFVASWAMEAAQKDVSPALATIFVALVAVLPEYAVDLYYAWGAGVALKSWDGSLPMPLAMGLPSANMTGANRLLIGLGWPMVVLLHAWKSGKRVLELGDSVSLELSYLTAATLYAFIIPFRDRLSVVDGIVYLSLFALYLHKARQMGVAELEMEGPAQLVAELPTLPRRILTCGLFLLAATAILLAAEPFAGGLIHIGERFKIEPFILVQWLAPIASEAPEFIVAALLSLQGSGRGALAALISSKVNQWTLLVGMIPLAVCLAAGGAWALPLDGRQREELLLTAAQSLFAIAILAGRQLSVWNAAVLAGLFVGQMLVPGENQRIVLSGIYVALAFGLLCVRRDSAARLWRGMAKHIRF